jgi:hypothetical protein
MRTKNPLSPLWSHHVLAERPYSLAELQSSVDTKARFADEGPCRPITVDHADADVVTASNAFFRCLSNWAAKEIRIARDDIGCDEETWLGLVWAEAYRLARSLVGDTDDAADTLDYIAGRIGRWTWLNVKPREAPLDADAMKAVRQANAAKTANVKTGKTLTVILGAAHSIANEGRKVTQQAVLEHAKADLPTLGERTLRRYWPDVLAAVSGDKSKSVTRPLATPVKKIYPTAAPLDHP